MEDPATTEAHGRQPLFYQVEASGRRYDVTQPFHGYDPRESPLIVPDPKKEAVYWNFFHIKGPVESCIGVCNLCGKHLSFTNRSYKSMGRHCLSNTKVTGIEGEPTHAEVYNAILDDYPLLVSDKKKASSGTKKGKTGSKKAKKKTPRKRARAAVDEETAILERKNAASIKRKVAAATGVLDAKARFAASTLSFDLLDTDEFKNLSDKIAAAALVGATYSQSSKEVKAHVFHKHQSGLESLKKRLVGKSCSVVYEQWKSRTGPYNALLTCQWFDDEVRKLCKAVLAIYSFPDSIDGATVIADFKTKMQQWGIPLQSVAFFSASTGDNIDQVGQELLSEGIQHIHSVDHIIEKIASIALDTAARTRAGCSIINFGQADESFSEDSAGLVTISLMGKIRRIVKFINKSPKVEQRFEAIQQNGNNGVSATNALDVIEDSVSCFWSSFDCIHRILQLREPLRILLEEGDAGDSILPEYPSLMEWDTLQDVLDVLGPFRDAHSTLSAEGKVTLTHTLGWISVLKNHLKGLLENSDSSVDHSVMALAREMYSVFEEHFGKSDLFNSYRTETQYTGSGNQIGIHPCYFKALAVDPSTKALTAMSHSMREKVWDEILQEMVQMKHPILREKATIEEPSVEGALNQDDESHQFSQPARFDPRAAFASLYDNSARANNGDGSNEMEDLDLQAEWKDRCVAELKMYKTSIGLSTTKKVKKNNKVVEVDSDPFADWWHSAANPGSLLYPTVYSLAKKYLVVPAIMTSSERARAAVVSPRDTDLAPEISSAFEFVRENWEYCE